jgi:hypothetical protein
VGDKVLVLLPSPGSKLEVKWQGPFMVTKVFNDGLNYEIDTGKTRKQLRTYHINFLNKWQSRDEVAALIMPESPNMSLPHESKVFPVDNNESWRDVVISDDLSKQEFKQVRSLLEEYADVFSGRPIRTNITEHQIDT